MSKHRKFSQISSRWQVVGFTLLEVVIALSILSLIMLATLTGFRTLANTQVSLEGVTQRVDEVRAVSSFLRESIGSAAVDTSDLGGLSLGGSGGGEAYFALDEDGMVWRSTLVIGERFGGSYFLRLAREDDLLVLRWQEPGRSGLPDDWNQTPMRALTDRVQVFDIFWREDYQDPWKREWDPGDKATWVKIDLKTRNRFWPELIVRVP